MTVFAMAPANAPAKSDVAIGYSSPSDKCGFPSASTSRLDPSKKGRKPLVGITYIYNAFYQIMRETSLAFPLRQRKDSEYDVRICLRKNMSSSSMRVYNEKRLD